MLGEITVTIVSTTTTDENDLGDTSTDTNEVTVDGVMFAPRSSQERTNSREPAVYTAASLYFGNGLPDGVALDSDDEIRIADVSSLIDGTYQVEGIPGYWGGPVEVAVTRTGSV